MPAVLGTDGYRYEVVAQVQQFDRRDHAAPPRGSTQVLTAIEAVFEASQRGEFSRGAGGAA